MLEMVAPASEKLSGILHQSGQSILRQDQGVVVSYSLPWPQVSLLAFLGQAANAPRVYWESDQAALTFAGFGIAARLSATGPDRFQEIQQRAADLFANSVIIESSAPTEAGPRLFGGFAFQPEANPTGLWSAFPAASFILPRYQLTHSQNQVWLTINHRLEPGDDPVGIHWRLSEEIEQLQLATYRLNRQTSSRARSRPDQPVAIDDVMSQATWERLVAEATSRIRHSELDKVVLARARQMRSSQPIDPVTVLARLALRYPDCYRFLFEPIPGHAFYGATPELLAEVTGSTLRTVAMAGSIRRGDTPGADDALGRQLMTNPKERHEHALVVDAIRENLAPLVSNLNVPDEPGLCRLSNIQHLETVIQGQLSGNGGILPVVEALHPTPAVGGRPRAVALDIINEVEPTPRGWYASPVGWLDHRGNGLFAVAIRSAVSVGSDSMLFAGAGIVADSVPDKEWRETQLKFRPLLEALAGVTA